MIPAKRKLDDDSIKQETEEETNPNHLVKLVIGNHVQYTTRTAIQELLADPAYFHNSYNGDGNAYRIRLPADVEPLPAHMVLLSAFSPEVPLDWKSTAKGLTLDKVRKAASYFKIDGNKIGLPQPPAPVAPKSVTVFEVQCAFTSKCKTPEFMNLSLEDIAKLTRKNYLAVKTEMDVYQAIMNWCQHDYPSRWKKEIFDVLLAEIRWDLLSDALEVATVTAMGHLKDALTDLQKYLFPSGTRHTVHPRQRHFTETVYLFYADRNQVLLRRFDWRTNKVDNVVLPAEIKPWSTFKALGPFVNNCKLWVQIEQKKQEKNLLWSLTDNTVQWMFEDSFVCAETYAMACIDGLLYGWDFRGLSDNYVGYRCDPGKSLTETDFIALPKHLRTEAAYDSWNGKFYYCGGTPAKGKTFDALSIVEVYDASTNKWSRLPDMSEARRCFAAKICNGYLYVTGGACSTGFGILHTCERLNLKSSNAQWEAVAGLSMMRYGHAIFVVNNQVYVCGGFTCQGARASSMERYDAPRNCWVRVCAGSACELVSACATTVLPYY